MENKDSQILKRNTKKAASSHQDGATYDGVTLQLSQGIVWHPEQSDSLSWRDLKRKTMKEWLVLRWIEWIGREEKDRLGVNWKGRVGKVNALVNNILRAPFGRSG